MPQKFKDLTCILLMRNQQRDKLSCSSSVVALVCYWNVMIGLGLLGVWVEQTVSAIEFANLRWTMATALCALVLSDPSASAWTVATVTDS